MKLYHKLKGIKVQCYYSDHWKSYTEYSNNRKTYSK